MDARYRKLYPRLWRHAGFVALDHADKLLALYILTGPQTNRIGCFVFSPGAASEDLAIPLGTFRKRLRNVCQTFGWTFDDNSRVLLVSSWWAWNIPENANVLKGAFKDVAELPETPVYAEFYEQSRNVCQTLGVTFPERIPKPSPIQEQEQYQEQQQQQDGSARFEEDGFEAFWSAYPKKVSRPVALRAWEKLSPDAAVQSAILEAVAACAKSHDWRKLKGKFVPHPATWLHGRRWEDPLPQDAEPIDAFIADYAAEYVRVRGGAYVATDADFEAARELLATYGERVTVIAHTFVASQSERLTRVPERTIVQLLRHAPAIDAFLGGKT